MPRNPSPRRTAPAIVWALHQRVNGRLQLIGHYSTDEKAIAQAGRLITKACGARSVKVPAWRPLSTGGQELIYGRDERSWWFVVEPHGIDGEAS